MADEVDIEGPVEEPEVPHLAPTYAPSPTAEEAIRAFANGPRTELRLIELESSRGEGKTTAGIWCCAALAERVIADGLSRVLPVKVGLIRDTWVNIQRALSLESPVLTPTGWVKAGDVSVGDTLISQDGSPARVLGVYPQPEQQLWHVVFSDGAAAHVTGDHLWAVQGRWDREHRGVRNRRSARLGWLPGQGGLRIVKTDQLRERLHHSRRRQPAWSIPLVEPVQFPSRPVPINPYVLGVLLGDGGISTTSVNISTADHEIISNMRSRLPHGLTIKRVTGTQYDYTIVGRGRGRYSNNRLQSALRDLGLFGLRSPEKFIPDVYLWNDQETRLALLRGLMDTDGSASRDRHVSFSSTSERLIEGVEFLVRSLGGLTKRTKQDFHVGNGHLLRGHWVRHRHPLWSLAIKLPPTKALIPFALRRKTNRVESRNRKPWRWIVGVEAAGHGPAVCFKVDHPSGLFVMNDFIVTHNTTVDAFVQARAKGAPIEFFNQQHDCILYDIGGHPLVHFYFFGLDRPDQADNLQGFQCGVLWLEEIAPAATMSAGIPAEALGLGVTSVRQEGVPGRILLTFNPPPPDHWVTKIETTLEQVGLTGIRIARYIMAPGEKSAHFRALADEAETAEERKSWIEAADVFDAYRERNRIFLTAIGREDLAQRLVHGIRGAVQEGEALVRSFSREHHVTKQPIPILPGVPILRFWDAGLTPSTVWAQAGADWMNVLGSKRSDHGGMEQHILNYVLPFQEKYGISRPKLSSGFGKPAHSGFEFEDIGDPACLQGSQANSEQTVARIIEAYLGTFFQPGPVEWSARREALQSAFWRKGGAGKRMFILIDPDENEELIQSLEGRAHFPKDVRTGRIIETVEALKRASGVWFQILDALAYGLAVKFPADEWMAQRLRELAPKGPAEIPPATWLGR